MNPMNTAPRDGTRVLIKTKTMGWSADKGRNVVTGDKWVEARWAKDLSGQERWVEWCGNPETHTTGDIVPLGWAPLPPDEDGFTEQTVPAPDTIVRFDDGSFMPIMFHYASEDMLLKDLADANGFDIDFVLLEDDVPDDHPAWIAYFEDGKTQEHVLPLWKPEPVLPDFKLVAEFDTEDGLMAVFIRKRKPE